MEKEVLKSLLLKRRQQVLTEQEESALAALMDAPQHQSLLEEVFTELILAEQPDETYDAARFEPMLELAVDIDRQQPDDQSETTVISLPFRRKWKWVAAAVFVLASAGLFYFQYDQQQKELAIDQKNNLPGKDIQPGTNRALLTLDNGSIIDLDSKANGLIASVEGSEVNKQNGTLEYHTKEVATTQVTFNTLSTPRGGQYQVVLPDGSKVWLNAASSLRYPTRFTGTQRKVELKGEAYFDIAADKSKPFIVQSQSDQVTVLGTQFNMNAYPDEQQAKTTLVEGAVKVNESLLKPGQAYSHGKVHETNIEDDISWKNGYFNLNGQQLESIMRQLERWYDIETRFQGNAKNIRLKGKMDRGMNLADVLYFFEEMQIRCKLEGRTLTIYGN